MSHKITHYKKWSSDDVVEYIISINPSKFEKYRNLLHTSLVKNNFTGSDIDDLDLTDLKQYGIINLTDRKLIYKSLTKLKYTTKKPQPNHPITSHHTSKQLPNHTNTRPYGNGGWLPSKAVLLSWQQNLFKFIKSNKKVSLSPAVQALSDLIHSNEIINDLTHQMIEQYKISHSSNNITESRIENIDHMLQVINNIIHSAPKFYGKHLIGVPLAALFTGVNSTLAGQTLFRIKLWNKAIQNILGEWCQFLYTDASFPANNSWLSDIAKHKWAPEPIGMDLWLQPENGWKCWNDFFARDINRKYRPISSPNNNNIITSANDGGFIRMRKGIKLTDTFWLKDMPYSLTDIFGGENSKLCQQYAHKFVNGTIFQTFLNPFNYHCFWAPVSGKIIAKTVLEGLYYSKLILPDYYGTSTASCPYLMEVNARGIFIIDTKDTLNIGLVCCVPIGMCEVSSIVYEDNIKVGQYINKGDKFGHFAFGGSSFAIIFEDVSKYNKMLTFNNNFNIESHSLDDEKKIDDAVNGSHSNVINVGSQIAVVSHIKKEQIFTDRIGNEFIMDVLSNRLELFDETVHLISDTISKYEPTSMCAKTTYNEWYYYFKTVLDKMRLNNDLNLVFIFMNKKTNELAFVVLCNDFFDESQYLNKNEMEILVNKGGKVAKVLEFVEELDENGLNEFKKDIANSNIGQRYINYLNNKEKGHFLHFYVAAGKKKYMGNGATPIMFKAIGMYFQKSKYKYIFVETTNPITQHMAKKYGNAKTYSQLKFSDYFQFDSKKIGISKNQTAMFQVMVNENISESKKDKHLNNIKKERIFTDRIGNEYIMDVLSNRIQLFDEAVHLIANTINLYEPTSMCAKTTYNEWYYYLKTVMDKMKVNGDLNLVFIFMNKKTNELAFVVLCNDFFDESQYLNENEMEILVNKGGKVSKVLEFVEELDENGLNAFKKDIANSSKGRKYINYLENKMKGYFLHFYIAAGKKKYMGNGATPIMFKAIGMYFKQSSKYKYLFVETTNPITQHMAKKYGNAKTYSQLKFSDYFQFDSKKIGIAKNQTAMFQVMVNENV